MAIEFVYTLNATLDLSIFQVFSTRILAFLRPLIKVMELLNLP